MKRIPIEFLVAAIFSVVACSLASLLWFSGHSYLGFGYYLGDLIFKIGSPLTLLIFSHADLHGGLGRENDAWILPVLSLLFAAQMFLWSLLIYLLRHFFTHRGNEKAA